VDRYHQKSRQRFGRTPPPALLARLDLRSLAAQSGSAIANVVIERQRSCGNEIMKRSGDMWIRDEDQFMGQFFGATGDRYDIDHLNIALSHCTQMRTGLDIGANYGSWSRYMAPRFERVLSFEPVQASFDCCSENLTGFDNVTLKKQAVGRNAGRVSVAPGKMYDHPGMETVVSRHGDIEMICIDDLHLTDVDFMKIDVEGYELYVLLGATETLRACKPIVIFEENIRGPLEHGVANGDCAMMLEAEGARLLSVHKKDFIFGWVD
jgi:FkbM family methyltransferase